MRRIESLSQHDSVPCRAGLGTGSLMRREISRAHDPAIRLILLAYLRLPDCFETGSERE